MAYEVVIVGGGIGGLTAGALLAARGVDVCVLERQPEVGGCVVNLAKFDYVFEPTLGLYAGWREGEVHQKIFAELPVAPPEILPLNPAYVARLPDGLELAVSSDPEHFESSLRRAFPECAAAAVRFYRDSQKLSHLILGATRQAPDFPIKTSAQQIYSVLPKVSFGLRLLSLRNKPVRQMLDGTSERFQNFIDLQLQTIGGASLDQCSYLAACILLNLPRTDVAGIRGGAGALANKLAESIRNSGAKIRLDSPVLRLAYDAGGNATGVDLLNGETITATKAIISNMTVWDTYGKLIGLNRTPAKLKKQLSVLRTDGAYLIYAGMDESAALRLPAEHLLIATKQGSETENVLNTSSFCFAAAPGEDARGPEGMRAVTIVFSASVDEWFTYQADVEEHERRDQLALELGWQAVHDSMPELGADIEVIDTANPQSYYELTRRKLGMVGNPGCSITAELAKTYITTLPNVFIVGDTAFPFGGVFGASHSGLIVANEIVG